MGDRLHVFDISELTCLHELLSKPLLETVISQSRGAAVRTLLPRQEEEEEEADGLAEVAHASSSSPPSPPAPRPAHTHKRLTHQSESQLT